MTSIQFILLLLNKDEWMVTIDLKDAYFHISTAPQHRKYLRFTVGNKHYQYKALPFGIASAPGVFTKVMVVIISTVVLYLDDWLIVADSAARHLQLTLNLLESFGIQVNWKKSQLSPTQRIQYIGAILDTVIARAFLPQDKAQKLWTSIADIYRRRSSTALCVQRLLGHMAAAIPVVPLAKLQMRMLQLSFLSQFNPLRHAQSR